MCLADLSFSILSSSSPLSAALFCTLFALLHLCLFLRALLLFADVRKGVLAAPVYWYSSPLICIPSVSLLCFPALLPLYVFQMMAYCVVANISSLETMSTSEFVWTTPLVMQLVSLSLSDSTSTVKGLNPSFHSLCLDSARRHPFSSVPCCLVFHISAPTRIRLPSHFLTHKQLLSQNG